MNNARQSFDFPRRTMPRCQQPQRLHEMARRTCERRDRLMLCDRRTANTRSPWMMTFLRILA
jgi:hypothetical protein